MKVDLGNMPAWASNIAEQLRAHGFAHELADVRQILCLCEETGELLKAWRLYKGWARREGEFADVEEEMADVIITAYVTAYCLGVDLVAAIDAKLQIIFTRGWREIAEILPVENGLRSD